MKSLLRRPDALAVVVITLIGALLRSYRFWINPIGLWLDEAMWTLDLLDLPLRDLAIRPIGTIFITKLLIQTWGPHEQLLRLLPYVFGIAVPPLAYFTARELLQHRALRLLVPCLFALHPLLIDFSKEFKPYSIEVFCQLLVLTLTLHCLRAPEPPSRRAYTSALLAPLLVLPFCYNILFTYPAVYGLLWWQNYRRARLTRSLWTVAAGLGCLGAIVALQFGLWRHIDQDLYGSAYWGNKYDVFLVADRDTRFGPQPAAATAWFIHKYLDLFGGPGFSPPDWQSHLPAWIIELRGAYRWLWAFGCLAGLVSLWRRDRQTLVLLTTPLIVLGLFNALGKWPMGLFRVNLFTLVQTTFIPLTFVDAMLKRHKATKPDADASRLQRIRYWLQTPTGVSALILLPRLTSSAPDPAHKASRPWMAHSEAPAVIALLDEKLPVKKRSAMITDIYSYRMLRYYLELQPTTKRLNLNKRLSYRRAPVPDAIKKAVKAHRSRKVWVLVSRQDFVPEVRRGLRKVCDKLKEYDVGRHHLLARCVKARSKKSHSKKSRTKKSHAKKSHAKKSQSAQRKD